MPLSAMRYRSANQSSFQVMRFHARPLASDGRQFIVCGQAEGLLSFQSALTYLLTGLAYSDDTPQVLQASQPLQQGQQAWEVYLHAHDADGKTWVLGRSQQGEVSLRQEGQPREVTDFWFEFGLLPRSMAWRPILSLAVLKQRPLAVGQGCLLHQQYCSPRSVKADQSSDFPASRQHWLKKRFELLRRWAEQGHWYVAAEDLDEGVDRLLAGLDTLKMTWVREQALLSLQPKDLKEKAKLSFDQPTKTEVQAEIHLLARMEQTLQQVQERYRILEDYRQKGHGFPSAGSALESRAAAVSSAQKNHCQTLLNISQDTWEQVIELCLTQDLLASDPWRDPEIGAMLDMSRDELLEFSSWLEQGMADLSSWTELHRAALAQAVQRVSQHAARDGGMSPTAGDLSPHAHQSHGQAQRSGQVKGQEQKRESHTAPLGRGQVKPAKTWFDQFKAHHHSEAAETRQPKVEARGLKASLFNRSKQHAEQNRAPVGHNDHGNGPKIRPQDNSEIPIDLAAFEQKIATILHAVRSALQGLQKASELLAKRGQGLEGRKKELRAQTPVELQSFARSRKSLVGPMSAALGQLQETWAAMQMQRELHEYQSGLELLRDQVHTWRRMTRSQHSGDLEDGSVVIREACRLIQLRAERESRRQSLEAESCLRKTLQQELDKLQAERLQRLKELLAQPLGLPSRLSLDIDKIRSSHIEDLMGELRVWQAQKELEPRLTGTDQREEYHPAVQMTYLAESVLQTSQQWQQVSRITTDTAKKGVWPLSFVLSENQTLATSFEEKEFVRVSFLKDQIPVENSLADSIHTNTTTNDNNDKNDYGGMSTSPSQETPYREGLPRVNKQENVRAGSVGAKPLLAIDAEVREVLQSARPTPKQRSTLAQNEKQPPSLRSETPRAATGQQPMSKKAREALEVFQHKPRRAKSPR